MNNNFIKGVRADSRGLKSLDLAQYPDDAWVFYSEKPKKSDIEQLFTSVAAVYRAMNINADAVANLPFEVYKDGADDDAEPEDTSQDWENVVGWLPNPKELIRQWRMSLAASNRAYGFMERDRRKGEYLRYIIPDSVKPYGVQDGRIVYLEEASGMVQELRGFERAKQRYNIKNDGTCTIFHMWRMDHTAELLPSENTELMAMNAAAGILYYSDLLMGDFFKRGGVDPHMLMVKGVTSPEARDRIERAWTRFITGITKTLGKVFNAEAVEAVKVGELMQNWESDHLYRDRVVDIAMAAHIPPSLLLAESANYATAEIEYASWYRDTVYPYAEWMARTMNERLFIPHGYQLRFKLQETDVSTEEETKRAEAFAWYVSANMKPSVAAQVLGIDLPKGVEYVDLDDMMQAGTTDLEEGSTDTVEPPSPNPQLDERREPNRRSFSINEMKELQTWSEVAVRRYKRGQELEFDYIEHYGGLPDDITDSIKEQLAEASTDMGRENLKAIFEPGQFLDPVEQDEGIDDGVQEPDAELKALADALNNAADKMSVQPYVFNMPPITVNTPETKVQADVNVPEIKAAAPNILVNVPEQPPPTVTVNNQVETPKVEVTNEVKPPDVKKPKKVKIKPNVQGGFTMESGE